VTRTAWELFFLRDTVDGDYGRNRQLPLIRFRPSQVDKHQQCWDRQCWDSCQKAQLENRPARTHSACQGAHHLSDMEVECIKRDSQPEPAFTH
jgi:hypothetical protein